MNFQSLDMYILGTVEVWIFISIWCSFKIKLYFHSWALCNVSLLPMLIFWLPQILVFSFIQTWNSTNQVKQHDKTKISLIIQFPKYRQIINKATSKWDTICILKHTYGAPDITYLNLFKGLIYGINSCERATVENREELNHGFKVQGKT